MCCLPLPRDMAGKHGGGCRGCEGSAHRASPGPSPGRAWGLLFPFIGCQVSAQDLYGQIQNPWKAGLGTVGTKMLPLPCCCNYATKLRKQRKSRIVALQLGGCLIAVQLRIVFLSLTPVASNQLSTRSHNCKPRHASSPALPAPASSEHPCRGDARDQTALGTTGLAPQR